MRHAARTYQTKCANNHTGKISVHTLALPRKIKPVCRQRSFTVKVIKGFEEVRCPSNVEQIYQVFLDSSIKYYILTVHQRDVGKELFDWRLLIHQKIIFLLQFAEISQESIF
jgi:hypothetical protein